MSRRRNRARKANFQAQKREQRREVKKQKQPTVTQEQTYQSTAVKTGSPRPARSRWCEHWQVPFNLGDGLVIFASAFSDRPSKWEDDFSMSLVPDIGFYLDTYWANHDILVSPGLDIPDLGTRKTKVVMYPWPDRGAPIATLRRFRSACEWLLRRIEEGAMVETGCFAAHGRTGTLLASLLVLKGAEANAAINEVRAQHCDQAVESWEQIDFVKRFDTFCNGRIHPPGGSRVVASDAKQGTIFSERRELDGMTCIIGGEKHVWSDSRGWMSAADIERAAAATMAKYDDKTGFASSLDTSGMTPATKAAYGLDNLPDDPDDQDYQRWLKDNTLDMSTYMGGGMSDDEALREHASYVRRRWGSVYEEVTDQSQALFQATCPWCGSTNVDWVSDFNFVCNQCDQTFTDKYADRGI